MNIKSKKPNLLNKNPNECRMNQHNRLAQHEYIECILNGKLTFIKISNNNILQNKLISWNYKKSRQKMPLRSQTSSSTSESKQELMNKWGVIKKNVVISFLKFHLKF